MRTDVVYPRARVVQPFVLDGKKKKNSYLEGGGCTSYTYCRQVVFYRTLKENTM